MKDPVPHLHNPFALLVGGKSSKHNAVHKESTVGAKATEVVDFSSDYHSPLMLFKSYRLSSNYPLKLNSATHSHKVDPFNTLCRFDLHGICNDDECPYQHSRDYQLSEKVGRSYPMVRFIH